MGRLCAICRKNYTFGSYWICPSCYHKWKLQGRKQRNWPDWVKALISIERRNERHELKTVRFVEFT